MPRLVLYATLFFFVAPGTVAGLIPYLLTRWESHNWYAATVPARSVGAAFLVAGLIGLLDSFRRFVVEGRGTPAPVKPPTELVVNGLYRYVRNPMYVTVLAMVIGEALILGRFILFGYAVVLWLLVQSFVVFYEEPKLARMFGASYAAYRASVPRWIPRVRAWRR
jgi:protein-S-isoprenylcysteine O-methyltransferase Ste14